ncbi:lipid A export permease/ATP-binding protein MsbA [bacterium]|nr:lipid A export permease/ATP-binding protein MsbA [bacterium]
MREYLARYFAKDPESLADFRRLWGYFRPYIARLAISLACALIVAGTTAATAKLLEPVMNEIFVNKDRGFLYLVPWLIIGLFGLKGVFRFLQNYILRSVGERVIRRVRGELYHHYQYLDPAYYAENNVGVMMSRITNDVNMMQRAIPSLESLVREPVTMLGLAIVAFWQFWQGALAILVVIPVTAVPIVIFGRKIRKWVRRGQERMGEMSSILKETFSGVRVIKAFGMEEYEIRRFDRENKRVFEANLRTMFLDELSSPLIEFLAALGGAVVVVSGGLMVMNGRLTTGAFFSFMAAFGLMYEPLKKINKMNVNFQAALAAARRVFSVLDTPPSIDDAPGATELSPIENKIHFDNVRFRYRDDGPFVLDGIDVTVRTGQVVALVGSSGAGKTTFGNLLPRFWDVTEGAIRIDGADIRGVTVKSLRRQIGMVTQDTFLFNDTVLANIAYGDENADRERARACARTAHADGFIEQMPNGYDTVIGEMGVKISGGQRQRLAIARALYKDAPILILDEATSSLDAESEREVQAALEQLLVGRTSFVIAHRLSTIRRADRILVLRDGRVVEDGTHDELIVRDGEYARLYKMQFAETGA